MAIRFETGKGGVPTGNLQSYDPNKITLGGKTYGGGGGGTSAPTSLGTSQADQQAEAQRQAEQKALAEQIEKDRQKAIFEANRDYQANLRNIHSQSERQVESSKLQERISQAQINARLQRVESGIVKATTFTRGGYAEGSKYIPREEIKVGVEQTQQFRETYGITKGYNVPKELTPQEQTKENLLNTINQDKSYLLPSKPVSVVSKAPTTYERIRGYYLPEGEKVSVGSVLAIPKRTLNLLSGELQRAEDIKQQKTGEFYQSQASITAVGMAPQIAYFTPAGATLLVSGGAEKLTTTKGQEGIKQNILSYQEKGYGKIISNVLGYGVPVVEVSVGLLGLRSQGKSVLASRELKAFENTPLKVVGQRLEKGGVGVDILRGYKKVGDTKYYIKVTQPFRQVGETKTIMEAGQGIAYKVSKGGKIDVVLFESGGRAYNLGTIPKLTKGQVIKSLEEFQAGTGRIYTKPLVRGEYTIESGVVLPKTIRVDITGKAEKVIEKPVFERFIGYSKEGEGYFSFVSGEPTTARVYKTGIKSVIAKRDIFGIVRTKMPARVYDVSGGESPLVITTQKPSLFSGQILKSGLSSVAPTPIKTTGILPFVSASEIITQPKQTTKTILDIQPTTKSVTRLISIPQVEETRFKDMTGTSQFTEQTSDRFGNLGVTKTLFDVLQPVKSKEKSISIEQELLKSEEKTKQKPFLRTELINKLQEKQREKYLTKQLQLLKQKQEYKQSSSIMNRLFQQPKQTPKPKIPLIPPFPTGSAKQKLMGIAQGIEEFEVFTRKKGEEISLGEFTTFKEARKKLISEVKGTLRASAFITKGGEKIPFEKLDLGYEFTPSKRDIFRAVQKRGFRLGTREEVREIILAKRGKSKRFKLI